MLYDYMLYDYRHTHVAVRHNVAVNTYDEFQHGAWYLALTAACLAASSCPMLCWYTLRTKNALPSMSYTTEDDKISSSGCVGCTGEPASASAMCKSLSALEDGGSSQQ